MMVKLTTFHGIAGLVFGHLTYLQLFSFYAQDLSTQTRARARGGGVSSTVAWSLELAHTTLASEM